ncbi:MAG: DUF5804 family protein [Methanocorpusculum sp.]|uniref:DUF5804 family protein n=1 Tax=Methanocorpusculum sp. TaxID=2058474 RepID=UPI0027215641|nr:DUF5804 family protein [Methanocorpusculum sp.]MDO9523771.1 DUF5804 family protein [Methanocorpusculum sp.]
MHLVCIGKPGVDLYRTLSDSETSRHILRFYHPKETPWGVTFEVATISSGLAMASELRWYIMRYMKEVLFEDTEHDVYLTRDLAREVYETRSAALIEGWNISFRVVILENGTSARVPDGVPDPLGVVQTFHVWGLAQEHP